MTKHYKKLTKIIFIGRMEWVLFGLYPAVKPKLYDRLGRAR